MMGKKPTKNALDVVWTLTFLFWFWKKAFKRVPFDSATIWRKLMLQADKSLLREWSTQKKIGNILASTCPSVPTQSKSGIKTEKKLRDTEAIEPQLLRPSSAKLSTLKSFQNPRSHKIIENSSLCIKLVFSMSWISFRFPIHCIFSACIESHCLGSGPFSCQFCWEWLARRRRVVRRKEMKTFKDALTTVQFSRQIFRSAPWHHHFVALRAWVHLLLQKGNIYSYSRFRRNCGKNEHNAAAYFDIPSQNDEGETDVFLMHRFNFCLLF